MAVRRRNVGPGPSFFSFQDIMMCCLGIMVLVATMLALLMDVAAERVEPLDRAAEPPMVGAGQQAAEIAALEARLKVAVELQNRDLAGEVARLRAELEADHEDLERSVERLQRVMQAVDRLRKNEGSDPLLGRVAQLLVERDGLRQTLQEMESRRRLTFRPGEGGSRTRVFEVSAARIVEAPAMGDGSAMVHTVRSAEQGASLLHSRMRLAEAQGLICLIALKPSGVDLYQLIQGPLSDGDPPRGLELIPEDRWIADQFPNWSESEDGG
jgi:hypothetical protein